MVDEELMEIEMSNEQKKAKILAAAETFGWPVDVYFNEAMELQAAGLIQRKMVRTAVGGSKDRWFLVK